MDNIQKVTSLELSKKIDALAKKKGIKLESEMYWYKFFEDEDFELFSKKDIINTLVKKKETYPALDTAEWGMILPEIIIFRKDRYELEIKEKWSVDYYFDSYPSCGGMLRLLEEISDQNCFDDNFAEAMGKMYFYLLDNNLL